MLQYTFVTIDEKNAYFQMIRSTWGQQLKTVFDSLEAPHWEACTAGAQPVRMPPPEAAPDDGVGQAMQSFAQQFNNKQQ